MNINEVEKCEARIAILTTSIIASEAITLLYDHDPISASKLARKLLASESS